MKRRSLNVSHAEAGRTLESFLEKALPASEAEARRWVEAGAVYVQGRRCRQPRTALAGGQTVVVVLEEGGRSALAPVAPPLLPPILFEDAHLVAVDKPAGVNAQPTPAREGESLLDAVERHLGRPAGLVHRLDRETSGVTVFGKTQEATSSLAGQFREGGARKRYLAVAGPGLPASGTIDLPISKDPSRPGRYRATKAAHGAPAVTDFTRLYEAPDFTLVALFPRTGRTHQLRAHLKALGAPIAGDARYGGAPEAAGLKAARCLLHAQGLRLQHPATGEPLLLEAPLPADMRAFWEKAGLTPPSGPW